MRYLGNNTNIVRDAELSATNGVASDAIYRTDTAAKNGGGLVELTGPYTGATDCTIDVEIVDNGGSTTTTSQPIFSGVGNGTMTDVDATGLDPQTVTATLIDTGTKTLAAYTSFQGATLRAKATGASGNDITIDVDHSGLVATDTDWSLRDDLTQGTNEYAGDHWDFGAAILDPDGSFPLTAPRLRFGTDPQVYRQGKKYINGHYVFVFEPSPVRDVAAGARVHAISGTRTVTVTDGVTTEPYYDIVSKYDALNAFLASDLIESDQVPILDRQPNGMAISELSVFTRSYILGVTTTNTGPIANTELDVTATATAPTETLSIVCADASIPGAEKWDVRGTVSGALTRAITAAIYNNGTYTFTIPLPEVDPSATSGTITVDYSPDGPRGAEAVIPAFCAISPLIGSAGRDGSWSFIYSLRPPADCDCNDGDYEGAPNYDCLGITPEGGPVSDASVILRMQRLAAKVREFVGSNTPGTPSQGYETDRGDVAMFNTTAAILKSALVGIASGTLTHTVWQASHAYVQDYVIEDGGRRYAATTPGTSGVSLPTFTHAAVGDTTTDNGVTWTYQGPMPFGAWDEMFDAWSAEMALLAGLGSATAPNYPTWSATTAAGDGIIPTARNGHTYRKLSGSGNTGATEPTWPTDGSSVADGDVVWIDAGAYWEASTSYTRGALRFPGTGLAEFAYTSGTTGATEPTWPTEGGITISDGTLQWFSQTIVKTPVSGEFAPPDEYYERWRSWASDVLAAAEIAPDFDSANTDGDGCWHDYGDSDYWWVSEGVEPPYMPLQTGHYNYSAKRGYDENGKPFVYSTKEWGFGIRIGCPESLVEGDRIKISISGANGNSASGYAVGDAFSVQVNHANPLPFGGGQTGDDTLTWSVVASVDGSQLPYSLVTTAPTPYSQAVGSGTLEFQITPGGIDFALGDSFVFAIEGGRFKWRQNGGSWSADLDIASTALVDGLTAEFTGGTAPSWVAGDRWTFGAEATFGVDNLRTPVDGEFAWTGSTVIAVEPDDGSIVGVSIVNHTIPSDATITLQGSDDDFATTPLSEVIPWRKGDIWHAIAADRARYRVAIDKGGSIRWLYLGETTQPTTVGGLPELGRVTKHRRAPSVGSRAGTGADVEHSALSQAGVDALQDVIDHASENDDRLIAFVPNDARSEVFAVRVPADAVDFEDVQGYQPEDITHSLQACTIRLEAAA